MYVLSISLRVLLFSGMTYNILVTRAEDFGENASQVDASDNLLNCERHTIQAAEALLEYTFIDVISVMNGLRNVIQTVEMMKDNVTTATDKSLMHMVETMIVASFDHLAVINDVYLDFTGNLTEANTWRRTNGSLVKLQYNYGNSSDSNSGNTSIGINVSNINNSSSNDSCTSTEKNNGLPRLPTQLDNDFSWDISCHANYSTYVQNARLLTSVTLRDAKIIDGPISSVIKSR